MVGLYRKWWNWMYAGNQIRRIGVTVGIYCLITVIFVKFLSDQNSVVLISMVLLAMLVVFGLSLISIIYFVAEMDVLVLGTKNLDRQLAEERSKKHAAIDRLGGLIVVQVNEVKEGVLAVGVLPKLGPVSKRMRFSTNLPFDGILPITYSIPGSETAINVPVQAGDQVHICVESREYVTSGGGKLWFDIGLFVEPTLKSSPLYIYIEHAKLIHVQPV